MSDITKDEWQEWAEMPQTREVKRRLEQDIKDQLYGFATFPREKWVALLDKISGMVETLDLLENIHKEG